MNHVSQEEPACELCGEDVDPTEDFCFGCKHFVCANCIGESVLLMGDHKVEDHRQVQ